MKRKGLLRHLFITRFVTGAVRRPFWEGLREASNSHRRKKMPGVGFEPTWVYTPGILSSAVGSDYRDWEDKTVQKLPFPADLTSTVSICSVLSVKVRSKPGRRAEGFQIPWVGISGVFAEGDREDLTPIIGQIDSG